MSATLALSAAFSLLSGALYALVAWRVLSRPITGPGKTANSLFAVWWFGLAATAVVGTVNTLAAYAGVVNLAVATATTYFTLVVLCVALWGLLYYLLYLFTGRTSLLAPLGAFYVAYYLVLAYLVAAANPIGVEVGTWDVRLAYENELGGPVATVAVLLLVGPQILGGLAYASLFFRVDGAEQRYRIGLVAGSIVFWFTSALIASLAGFGETAGWQVASRVISLAAALLVLAAFAPPAWVRERLKAKTPAAGPTP